MATGLLETIYLRCLDIEAQADGTPESLGALAAQLATISEMMAAQPDPAEDFELFVISKLSESTRNLVEAYLRQRQLADATTQGAEGP